MICDVCKKKVESQIFCPRCQFRLRFYTDAMQESDSERKYRAQEYRRSILDQTVCGIYVYEWNCDTTKMKPELKNRTIEYFSELDAEEPQKIIWLEEEFASRKGKGQITLEVCVKQNTTVWGRRSKELSVDMKYVWDAATWQIGIRCTEDGELSLCLGTPSNYTSKRVLNVYEWN